MIRRRLVALAVGLGLLLAVGAACSQAPSASPDPTSVSVGAEPPVAVTVPTGPETLATWTRQGSTATLLIPSDLLFSTDSAVLSPAAATVLHGIVEEIGTRPARVLVEGHADRDGTVEHNQVVSERRAAAVAAWLADDGLDRSTITTAGWGESRPAVDDAADEAAKAQNRRVVVTVTFSPPTSPPRRT